MDTSAGVGAEILRPRTNDSPVAVSAIVNFHREGEIGGRTLDGLHRVRRHAEDAGIGVEFIFVLDRADVATTSIVLGHPLLDPRDLVLGADCGDLGLSRNIGFAQARAEFACNFDGDDFFSANWIKAGLRRAKEFDGPVVVHPQFIVSFGHIQSVCQIVDQTTSVFPAAALLKTHPWIAHGLAPTALYRSVLFQGAGVAEGFGYEDWHWNLEVLTHGVQHVTAPETAIFYRRKAQSMLTDYVANNVVIRPTRFFEDVSWAEAAGQD